MEAQSNPVICHKSLEEARKKARKNWFGRVGGVSHVDQILGVGLILEVLKVIDDDGDEEVDHRDKPEDDQGDKNDRSKNSLGFFIFDWIIKELFLKFSEGSK